MSPTPPSGGARRAHPPLNTRMGTIMPQSHTHGTPDARQQQLEAANIEYFDALGETSTGGIRRRTKLAQRLVRALRRVLPLDEDATCVLDYACGSGTKPVPVPPPPPPLLLLLHTFLRSCADGFFFFSETYKKKNFFF